MNPDNDLRSLFQSQRHQIRQQAPAWRGLQAPVERRKFHLSTLMWLGASAAILLLSLGIWMQPAHEPKLSETLPVFLESPDTPLLAGLDDVSSSPSDLFLPVHLQLRLP